MEYQQSDVTPDLSRSRIGIALAVVGFPTE